MLGKAMWALLGDNGSCKLDDDKDNINEKEAATVLAQGFFGGVGVGWKQDECEKGKNWRAEMRCRRKRRRRIP